MTTVALHAGPGSIVLEPVDTGAPLWRHCGARVVADGVPPLAQTRAMASYSLDRDCPLSTAPVPAMGWFGPPVVALRRDCVTLPVAWTSCTWLGAGGDGLVWQAQGSLECGLLVWVIRTAPPQDRRPQPLNLPFLDGEPSLTVRLLGIAGGQAGHAAPLPALWSDAPVPFAGDWLARAGLPLPPLRAESVAMFHIVRTDSAVALPLASFPT